MTALAAFAALLDRSVARIAELSADGRYFDREQITRTADIWDNHSVPLLDALAGPTRRAREQRASSALRSMAGPGPDRRAWMIEQAAVAGHHLEPVLGPAGPWPMHSRDHAGRIHQYGAAPLTGLEVDYDLGAAVLHTVAVERAGTELGGHVAVAVPRRYTGATDDREAVLHLRFATISTARFDSDDLTGVSLTAGAEIRFGAHGLLRGTSVTVEFDDPWWHLSRAGRAADAATPATRPPDRDPGADRAAGITVTVALVLQQAMIEIRNVRHAQGAGRVPLGELCTALAEAGERLLIAAGRPWWARDRAFRHVMEQWAGASPCLTARLRRHHLSDGLRLGAPVAPPPAVTGAPARAQLTMARYTVPDTGRYPSPAIILAVPGTDGTWGLRSEGFDQPARMALDISAFTTEHPCTQPAPGSIQLGDRALVVMSEATNEPPGTSSRA